MVHPSVSVIIASYNSRATIERCLRALQHQQGPHEYQVIVVDSGKDGAAEAIVQKFPWVQLVRFAERTFPSEARNVGARLARGEILAFADVDCIVAANWISQLVRAHESNSTVIGGVIENANPESYGSWVYYFLNLSPWMPGTPAGAVSDLPAICLSVKRSTFAKYGGFLRSTFSSDTAFVWRASSGGETPLIMPSIRVSHLNPTNLLAISNRSIVRGRHFASVRVIELGFSHLRRLVHFLTSPFLPFLLFFRITRRVWRTRVYLGQFILAAPVVFVQLALWSFGELTGYLHPRSYCGEKNSNAGF